MTKHVKMIRTNKKLIRELSKVFLLCFLLYFTLVLLALRFLKADTTVEDFNSQEDVFCVYTPGRTDCKYVGAQFGVFQSKEDLKQQEKKFL